MSENLERRRDDLYVQLGELYVQIEVQVARQEGGTEELENTWIQLLQEYERVCDTLQQKLAYTPM